jgi:predicted dehydrogenase
VDTAAILVDFASGDIGLISISWGLPPGTPWVSGDNDILGHKGRIIRGGDNLQILREGSKVEKIEGLKTDMHKELMTDFVDAIQRDRQPRIVGEDGRIGLRMSLAALESIKTKQPVAL